MQNVTESITLVAWSDDLERLLEWYRSYKVEPYEEEGAGTFECHGDTHTWHKSFAKGSPLEWYNPITSEDGSCDHWGHGIQSEWVDENILETINIGIRV
jgi:hypothetical protein